MVMCQSGPTAIPQIGNPSPFVFVPLFTGGESVLLQTGELSIRFCVSLQVKGQAVKIRKVGIEENGQL